MWLRIAGGRIATLGARTLRDGPAEGWLRTDRDSESLAVDPATGTFTGGCDPRRDGYCVPV